VEHTRVGIIGLGRLGRKHAENLALHIPKASLAGICSVVEDELTEVAKAHDPTLVTTDYHELLGSDGLDALVIASSSRQYAIMIEDAVEAGFRNIYVEKPIAMTSEEITRLRRLLDGRSDLRLQVGYTRRHRSRSRQRSRAPGLIFARPAAWVPLLSRIAAGILSPLKSTTRNI